MDGYGLKFQTDMTLIKVPEWNLVMIDLNQMTQR
ncbi:hypothetical protein SAMN04490202_5107 [Pseudomonas reinekei]|jgi:hypothetical protein|uniref:Uncharacterized protein n=1 Tax=Pseudomonas reinekei TaxID=395598 RepID=A0A1H0U2R1_PSERE|nr:hypothetical protein SAMN04490202_5107 [Pseudomonas reinekei]